MLPAQRIAALDPSALSPIEYEAYTGISQEFENHHPHQQLGLKTPETIWEWISPRLAGNGKGNEEDILAFFPSVPESTPPLHILLALLRLHAHSTTNKHLTRDHLFIQTTPARLIESPLTPAPSFRSEQHNPFRSHQSGQRAVSAPNPPPLSPASAPAAFKNAPPVPPPPIRRSSHATPSSPQLPERKPSNPFRLRTGPPPIPLPESVESVSKVSVLKEGIASPPLPPRPSKEKLSPQRPKPPSRHVSNESKRPAIPERRSSVLAPHLSIISTSSAPIAPAPVPVLAPLPRSSFSTTTHHIGPSTNLRTGSPAPEGNESTTIKTITTRMSRSSSNVSGSSSPYGAGSSLTLSNALATGVFSPPLKASSPKKGRNESAVLEDDRVSVATEPNLPRTSPQVGTLGRSKTVGSKPQPPPPPPPKRRPESMLLEKNPFISSPPLSSGSLHRRAPSSSSSSTNNNTTRKDLAALGVEVGHLLEKGEKKGEEWVEKARNQVRHRNGTKVERQRLVYGEDEDGVSSVGGGLGSPVLLDEEEEEEEEESDGASTRKGGNRDNEGEWKRL